MLVVIFFLICHVYGTVLAHCTKVVAERSLIIVQCCNNFNLYELLSVCVLKNKTRTCSLLTDHFY